MINESAYVMCEITFGKVINLHINLRWEREMGHLLDNLSQPRTLSDDRGSAALERRVVRMPEPTEHHCGE